MMKVNILHLICIIALPLASSSPTVARATDVQKLSKAMEHFGTDLYAILTKEHPQENIVYSPFSIHTCIAMARMGAEGETARQLDQALALSAQKPEDLANSYHSILAQYANSSILKMANKMYVMTGCEAQNEFNGLLTKQFYSSVDSVNFANSEEAAHTINSWVEERTNHLIRDLVPPSLLDANTRLVLVNAIYFKGSWVHQFPAMLTCEEDFYLDETRTTKVQMMHIKKNFNYAELSELDAKALEMRYKDSDLSMLIILPNSRTGLGELEKNLKTGTSLEDITKQMRFTKVIVDMPKFKAEFETELSESLSQMGMKRMFSQSAEFGKMLKSGEGLKVSSVIHKAFIEVTESGTEAAAATGFAAVAYSAVFEPEPKRFYVDHGFYYAIRSDNGVVLFEGKQIFAQ